jgi:MFS family permease
MLLTAVGWQMYTLTGDPFDLGLVGLVQFIPVALLSFVAGPVADRYERRRVLQSCFSLEGLAALALAGGAVAGWDGKGYILLAVLLVGTGRAFELPTMQSILPAIAPGPLFPRAVAGSSGANQAASIAGPAFGGLLYAVDPVLVYSSSAALLVGAAALLAFIRVSHVVAAARPPLSPRVVFAGVEYIRRNRVILGVISLDLFAVLLGSVPALMPIFAKDVFAVGPAGLGILRAAPAVGALAVMIVLTRATFQQHVGRNIFIAVAAFGASTIVFALSTSFEMALIALLVVGATDAVGVVIRQTLVQVLTPDDMRGRVSAVNSLFINASNQLGDFRAGAVAAWLGTVPAIVLGGIGTLIVVVAWRKLFPELYRVQSFAGPAASQR